MQSCKVKVSLDYLAGITDDATSYAESKKHIG